VLVRAGNYTGGYFAASGTAALPIVLAAYPGETPVITADNGTTRTASIVMSRFTTNGGNTVLTLAQWQPLGQDANSLLATPAQLFVDDANNDYRLSMTSPAADVGETRADLPADIVNVPRPQGPGYDIGAYERQGDEIFADGFGP